MKWFKLDSDFTLDGKILRLDNRQFRAWMSIMSLISSKYTGNEREFECDLNSFLLSSKLLQKSLEMVLNSFINDFKIGYKLFINQNKIVFTYDKFLIKQEKYFRGVCKKTKSVTIEEEEEEEEEEESIYSSVKKNKSKKIKKDSLILKEAKCVIDFLNEKANRSFEYSDTTMNFVTSRLKDLVKSGIEIKEAGVLCRKVVSLKLQNDFFVQKGFLRPSTLYNKTKFNEYLEEVRTYEKQCSES